MNMDKRQKFLLFGAIIVVSLLTVDKLLWPPLTELWKKRSLRIVELKKNIEHGTQLLKSERRIRTDWAAKLRATLPSNASAAESLILKSVDRWAQASHVNLSSIKPQWKQNADDYNTLECRADANGDMTTLTGFLYNLEQDTLPLRVEDMQLSAHDNLGQELSLSVRFTGLALIEQNKEQQP